MNELNIYVTAIDVIKVIDITHIWIAVKPAGN